MENFKRIVRLGTLPHPYAEERLGRRMSIFCCIKYDGGRLSISGVEGPKSNGDALGSCGQIDMHLREPGGLDGFEPAPGWTLDKVHKFLAVWDEWHINDMHPYDAEMKAAGWRELARTPMLGFKFNRTTESSEAARAAEAAAIAALKAGEPFTPSPDQVAAVMRPHSFTIWTREGEPEPVAPEGFERSKSWHSWNKGEVEAPERKTLGWLRPNEHADGLLTRKLRPDGNGYGCAHYFEPVPESVLAFLLSLPESDMTPAWV